MRIRPIVVAVAVAMLALSACDSSGGEAAAPSSSAAPQDKALKYAQCMREHGVPMEDPKVEGGGVQLTVPSGSALDPAKQKTAEEACKQYAPFGQPGQQPDPVRAQQLLKYSQCMRENGVEKFPDPDGGMLRMNGDVASDPDFTKAQAACKDLAPGS
jgi:hypothetical protein